MNPVAAALMVVAISRTLSAQTAPERLDSTWIALPVIGGSEEISAAVAAMRSGPSSATPLLRSPLANLDRLTPAIRRGGAWLISPRIAWIYNAAIPQSANDAALWAGRGSNVQILSGVILARGRWRAILAPELAASTNRFFNYIPDYIVPPHRRPSNSFNSPFHGGLATIDLPYRFGEESIVEPSLGQSSISATFRNVRVAVGTENHWWGPAERNAILLSNNAPGFPHLSMGSPLPMRIGPGQLEWRWLVGGLSESEYYDSNSDNDLRSFSAAAVAFTPARAPTLNVGLARAVFATVPGWSGVASRALDFLRRAGHPNEFPATDSTRRRGRDQIFSAFARVRFPADGAEAYVEWARSAEPRSLRDLLADPAHSQGYTAGLRWLGSPRGSGLFAGALQVETEVTNLEVGSSVTRRETNSFYVSRAVEQGYTNRGQLLGAAIGPGGSSQWLALDWIARRTQAGLNVQRTRWENDAYFAIFVPLAENRDNAWCQHDVTWAPGVRGAVDTRYGRIDVKATTGKRYNMFFTHALYCPSTGVGREESARSISLRYSFRPR